MLYFLLLCLLCIVSCNWTTPLLLQPGGYAHETGIYLTPTGEILAFYSKDQSICYETIKGDEVIKKTCHYQAKPIKDLAVTATNNGVGVFVAFSAVRTTFGKDCNNGTKSGCVDVYYIESSDSGHNWSNAEVVPRRNLDDPVNRHSPQVLHIDDTGRTFIFYVVPGEDENHVYEVGRPKSSSIFTTEAKVYTNRYTISNLKVQYINVWETITIYLAVENLYWLTYISSSNNGIRWSKAKGLQYVTESLQYVMTKPASEDNLFVVTMDRGLLTLYVIDDEGSVVSSSFYHIGNSSDHKPFVVGYPEDGLRYIIGTKMERKNQSTHIFNVGQQLMTDLRISSPTRPSDKTITIKGDKYRISVLHNITNDLYISTLTLPTN